MVAAEAAARVGRSRGAAGAVHRQGCDRPHAAQFPAVQGGVHGQFIDRVLDIPVVLREGTHSAYCAEDCSWRRRLCDQQRQVPAVQRFESCAPDSVHPLSGEYSCYATDFRRDSTGAVLGVLGSC